MRLAALLLCCVASAQECGTHMDGRHVLTYFDVPSRGEAARVALHAAGVDYEDRRIRDWSAYQAEKAKGGFPTGVPVPAGAEIGAAHFDFSKERRCKFVRLRATSRTFAPNSVVD